MKVMIVTDAWQPQVNGVVTTLGKIGEGLGKLGHEVRFVTPRQFSSIPCPTYPEIRLSLLPFSGVKAQIESFAPDAVHIATEGPLGIAARRYCLQRKIAFTTAFHTRFAEYVHARIRIPVDFTYGWLRRFHAPSRALMVPARLYESNGGDARDVGPWLTGEPMSQAKESAPRSPAAPKDGRIVPEY